MSDVVPAPEFVGRLRSLSVIITQLGKLEVEANPNAGFSAGAVADCMGSSQSAKRSKNFLRHMMLASFFMTEKVNREDNLRIASSSLNKVSRKRRVGLSGFKGVSEHRSTPGRFQAIITIGTFSTAESAARAYDELAVLLWGEDARLNFPNAYDAKERGN